VTADFLAVTFGVDQLATEHKVKRTILANRSSYGSTDPVGVSGFPRNPSEAPG
jgi:hypothetical protein